jgi:hypothetical protein
MSLIEIRLLPLRTADSLRPHHGQPTSSALESQAPVADVLKKSRTKARLEKI